MDPGASDERTALAWQRTALAVMAGGAVMARISLDRVGIAAVVPLLAGLLLGGWAFVEAGLRYSRREQRGGRTSLVLSVAVLILAGFEGLVVYAQST